MERERAQEYAVSAGRLLGQDLEVINQAPPERSSRMMTRMGNWARSRAFATGLAVIGAMKMVGGAKEAEAGEGHRTAREIVWVLGSETDDALRNKTFHDVRDMERYEDAAQQVRMKMEYVERQVERILERYEKVSRELDGLLASLPNNASPQQIANFNGKKVKELMTEKSEMEADLAKAKAWFAQAEALLDRYETTAEKKARSARRADTTRHVVGAAAQLADIFLRR